MDKKYIDCELTSKEIFAILFREGLKVAKRKKKNKISDEEAIVLFYFFMRPFKEYDYYNNNNEVMKTFVEEDEVIAAIYKDMSNVVHCAHKEEYKLEVDERTEINFLTKLPFKAALRLFVALACSVLGEKKVKKFMDKTPFKFEKYGDEEARKRYHDKCDKKDFKAIACNQ